METQLFTQAVLLLLGGITSINLLISFISLLLEESKKSSIIVKNAKKIKADGLGTEGWKCRHRQEKAASCW